MPNQDPWTSVATELARLRAHDADPDRAERIRGRCLARLAVLRQGRERRRARLLAGYRRLEAGFAHALSTLYLAAALRALALLR